ncbi:MAG TPA: hypothetical protein VGC09_18975 [Rhodopila sp.]
MTDEGSEWVSGTAAPHPEEMKGTVEMKFGKLATITASGRTTPAGLISAAVLVSVVLIPLAMMIRSRR